MFDLMVYLSVKNKWPILVTLLLVGTLIKLIIWDNLILYNNYKLFIFEVSTTFILCRQCLYNYYSN